MNRDQGFRHFIESQIILAKQSQVEIKGYQAFIHSLYRDSFCPCLEDVKRLRQKLPRSTGHISLLGEKKKSFIETCLRKNNPPTYLIVGANSAGKILLKGIFYFIQ